jgi:hypothetical protein
MPVHGADEDGVLVLFGLRFHFGELPTVFSSANDPVYAHGCEEDDVEGEDAGCDYGGCFVCHCWLREQEGMSCEDFRYSFAEGLRL